MIKRENKFIRSSSQQGYARLYSAMLMCLFILISVISYQTIVLSKGRTVKTFAIPDQGEGIVKRSFSEVQLFPQTMPVLESGLYEIFVTVKGQETSVGKFSLTGERVILSESGEVVPNGVFRLPEPVTDITASSIRLIPSSMPQGIEFLKGGVEGERILLSFFETMTSTRGEFMLATPTDGNQFLNERSGLWFGDLPENLSRLNLPTPPPGWIYEGWLNNGERALTTGRFKDENRSDLFSGFSSDPDKGPNFPGEDFLKNPPTTVFPDEKFPVDLAGSTAELTLEPDLQGVDPTGAGQFGLVILTGAIPNRAVPQRLYPLQDATQSFPTATVVIR